MKKRIKSFRVFSFETYVWHVLYTIVQLIDHLTLLETVSDGIKGALIIVKSRLFRARLIHVISIDK